MGGWSNIIIFLCYMGCEIDDQYRNPNMNNKNHLVGQLTRVISTSGVSPALLTAAFILHEGNNI